MILRVYENLQPILGKAGLLEGLADDPGSHILADLPQGLEVM
ncbi:MAG: hypothetical protein NZ849_05415 [Meiothermus sp.]|nr:hypothetical protein [Meiothermus sp.]MCS7058139.1 hypothetical protein [Meiothermus sp.]MCS7194338.1 hypothetical protein [Meiothermus sp.]MCX7740046.1 hypothetical protein [Meiothermus sp.]MDW8089819.1 hypothetical protein [Meiothermus sp.]MDW8481754.1 hypothetical protein [Meiothermus sp.]